MPNKIKENLETNPTSPVHATDTTPPEMQIPESIGDNADQAEKEMEVDLNITIAEARRKALEYEQMHAQQKVGKQQDQ